MTTEPSIKIKGARVLVVVDEVEMEKDLGGGIKLIIAQDEKLHRAAQQTGVVLQVGPLAWVDCSDPAPWCKVGDRVLFTQYAGKFIPDPSKKEEKKKYYILNDLDIMAVID